jgi:hypothetical protein
MRFVHIAPDGAGYWAPRVSPEAKPVLKDKLERGDAAGGLFARFAPGSGDVTAMASLQQLREKGKACVVESVNGISTGQTL